MNNLQSSYKLPSFPTITISESSVLSTQPCDKIDEEKLRDILRMPVHQINIMDYPIGSIKQSQTNYYTGTTTIGEATALECVPIFLSMSLQISHYVEKLINPQLRRENPVTQHRLTGDLECPGTSEIAKLVANRRIVAALFKRPTDRNSNKTGNSSNYTRTRSHKGGHKIHVADQRVKQILYEKGTYEKTSSPYIFSNLAEAFKKL